MSEMGENIMEGITLEKKNGYAILRVDIPETRNALSVPIVEYMETLVDEVIVDKSIRAMVLTGGGEKSFIAGADIRKLVEMTPEESRYSIEAGHRLFSKIETMDIPSVAAVNGYCLGGGLEIASHIQLSVQYFNNIGNLFQEGGNSSAASWSDRIKGFKGVKFTLGLLF